MTQYFETTSRSSSSVTGLAGRAFAGLGENQHEVRRARLGRPHDRTLVAVAQLDGHGVEQRAVHDGVEPAVVSGKRRDVGYLEGRFGQPLPGGLSRGQLDRRGRGIETNGVVPQSREVQRQRCLAAAGVEYVTGDLALVDERGDLRLRLAQAPRRPGARELGGLATVGRIEIEIEFLRFSHNPDISTRLIYVNIVDMGATEDAPLGYLLFQVMATLRPEVAAALSPLSLTLPEFVCMRMLSMSPGLSSAELARLGNVSPQAMNTVLHRLENAQMVARPASVASGRALPASLTANGRALLQTRRVRGGRGRRPGAGQAVGTAATRVQTNAGDAGTRLGMCVRLGLLVDACPGSGVFEFVRQFQQACLVSRRARRTSSPPATRWRTTPTATRWPAPP